MGGEGKTPNLKQNDRSGETGKEGRGIYLIENCQGGSKREEVQKRTARQEGKASKQEERECSKKREDEANGGANPGKSHDR